MRLPALVCLMSLLGSAPAMAAGTEAGKTDCKATSSAEPATKPAPASADGTAPGNAGSTGWSGGTGGSYVGTVPAGSTSNAYQPATARGLDPMTTPPKPTQASC